MAQYFVMTGKFLRALAPVFLGIAVAMAFAAAARADHGFAHVSIDEVERFLGRPGVYIFDVNVPEIWAEHHLPGAIHVKDAKLRRYLPADKHAILIFYCAEPRCTASEAAATEAVRLGYTRVYVMAEGIFGWINAGKPVEKSTPQDK
ncbi:MAG TPA: rhodanese-like domain-containing protein [Candidatus Sulfotelmatobacter sp.]|nr:rhodanese-like domain-containing protein [Candidatus Sulfotelmatobacter sp.]